MNRLKLALSRTLTAAEAHLLIKGDFAAAEATLGFLFICYSEKVMRVSQNDYEFLAWFPAHWPRVLSYPLTITVSLLRAGYSLSVTAES